MWKDIPGLNGVYQVSDTGKVRKGKTELHPFRAAKKRYPAIKLTTIEGRKAFYVHELVALAFIGPRPTGADVMHRDDDPENNSVENLMYGSREENLRMSDKVGRGNLKLTKEDVLALRAGTKTCGEIAAERGVAYQTAHDALTGRNWGTV